MDTKKICERCVLPESRPGIWLDEEGVCNLCREYEKEKKDGKKGISLETEFTKMLRNYKSRGEYDCLVMCSGGKDSTAALYYMKKRYKLNPLAFMFDNGFETEDALENVKNAVEALGVDLVYFKSDFMSGMFSRLVKAGSGAVICHLCSLWYMDLTIKTAARYGISLVIAGWTKGQSREGIFPGCACDNAPEFSAMAEETGKFLDRYCKNDPRYKDFPRSMEEVLKRARKRQRCVVLSPHWFLPFEAETSLETIKKELGWKTPEQSYPAKTTNCGLNFLSVYLSLKHYGYTHYHAEMSRLIRQGALTREEALEALKVNFGAERLAPILKKLGCGPEDLAFGKESI
ncbi:MAG: 7-cyano-7-deazaguanine synthase [Candidatus Omnitrophica bacterium]|nr:7-cyano-7-deazaguanine synthase [Candidatus Omnitrophota bacterium]